MQRPTLSDFRAQWPAEAMGICQASPDVAVYANDTQQRLLMDPLTPDEGWFGGSVTLTLSITAVNGYAYTVTPREISRLIVMGICEQAIPIRNGFYEYMRFGAGLMPKNCRTGNCGQQFQAMERDNVVTFSQLLSVPQKIRIYPSDLRDTGLRVLIQGKDSNGLVVLSTDVNTGQSMPGEFLTLAFPFVDSVYSYSAITGIQKDQTYGPLQFYQVEASTGGEVVLSTMEPNEAVANYRRYLVNGIPATTLCCASPTSPLNITAQARLDFIPVANETDYLLIQNVPALIEESQSIRYSRMDSEQAMKQAVMHHSRAISLLNGQLDAYQGKTSTAISMPIFGSDKLRRQPV